MTTSRVRRRLLENVVVIWLDSEIDLSRHVYQHSLNQLRKIVNSIELFTYIDDCIDYLNEIKNVKVCMIVSDILGQQIVPCIQDISCLDEIYVFSTDQTTDEPWIEDYPKVKGQFTQIELLCNRLKRGIYQVELHLTPISIVSPSLQSNLNQLDQSFMYSLLIKDILLKMNNDDSAKKDFVQFCREQCEDNQSRLSVIEEFERDYHSSSSIWWYTRDCFVYPMLNKALRMQEIDIILKMGFFIRDLHQQIEQLSSNVSCSNQVILYRGQGMNNIDFEKLRKSKGGLLSFNNFLSTSLNSNLASLYADSARQNPDLTGVRFEIEIDPSMATIPFARVHERSYYEEAEQEILFSMHSVFRIGEMNEIEERLWHLKLILTNDDDEDLRYLAEFMRNDIDDETEWNRLINLMLKMGEFSKAEEIYRAIKEPTPTTDAMEDVNFQKAMGFISSQKGDNKVALEFYEKALQHQQQSLPPDHLDIATSYNNIADIRSSMGEYATALVLLDKSLVIRRGSLPENHFDLAVTYNNLGTVYYELGEYATALQNLKKTLEIYQEHLPWNHPDMGKAYSTVAEVYRSMGEYQNALTHFEKALAIHQRTLPSNHPHLIASYNNVGTMYGALGQWATAVAHLEKAIEINQRPSLFNQNILAKSFNNIGEVCRSMNNYTDALSYFEQAIEIHQKLLPSDHPDLAKTCNNMALTQNTLGNYTAALTNYDKVLTIYTKCRPANHPSFAILYNNIGLVYQAMKDYATAMSYYEKALDLQQQSLPIDHPDLASIHNNIGVIQQFMGNPTTALFHLTKALAIWQKSCPPNYPHLLNLHQSLSVVYSSLQRHEDAFRHELMALGIKLPDIGSPSPPHAQPHIYEDELD